ncbi:MAG: kelch repeat-containing protein [Planctomycetota bacterium]|nr:kelch repeat-containing protein [Planctomycetota bacterium]
MAAISLVSAGEKSFRLPETDLKQRVIWGSTCEEPEGAGLAFGGEDQQADDGQPHTRLKEAGVWGAIVAELRGRNKLHLFCERAMAIRQQQKNAAACARRIYFEGLPAADEQKRVQAELAPLQQETVTALGALMAALEQLRGVDGDETAQAAFALRLLRSAAEKVRPLAATPAIGVTADAVKGMDAARIDIEKAAEALDAEPPPRALSPLVYDVQSKLYVLFGGDHCDYLTNDTWVFDAAKRKWFQRRPANAPSPRAGHQLKAAGDGKVLLSGGYHYTSSTDYCGGQYMNVGAGDWVYDIAANAWTGQGTAEHPDSRVYRTGPFHPDFFLASPKPDAAATGARLRDLPVNAWVALKPPLIPRLDRCWGASILDIDRDQVLVWAGGHSSHGGTDVLHYCLSTNRWVLYCPVEFPLGQLYANTNYPNGVNFNVRPWITGHTYQNYGYDAGAKKLLFTGQRQHYYFYDPDAGDWTSRAVKPAGMIYEACFYTLTLCPTPQGTVCWTEHGKLFRFDAAGNVWTELKVKGKLPGASVDYSTLVYDSRRDRLLFFRCDYGKKYDGQVCALDMKELALSALTPASMAAVAPAAFAIEHACYDAESDLALMATVLDSQRTPAYDCAGNRWVSLKVGFEAAEKKDMFPRGPRRCCSLLWDARRKLIWGVDAYHCLVYVLRLDAKSADVSGL